MFYTCGPNEAMVVSGKVLALPLIASSFTTHAMGQRTQMSKVKCLCELLS